MYRIIGVPVVFILAIALVLAAAGKGPTAAQERTSTIRWRNSWFRKAGPRQPHSGRNVQRILFIGENLYTLSDGMLKAHDITTLAERGKLSLP